MFSRSIGYMKERHRDLAGILPASGVSLARVNTEPDVNDNERMYMQKVDRNQGERTSHSSTNAAHREVAFVLSSPEAEEVYLCGDFNQWSPRSLPMIRHDEDHWWEKHLVLEPGRYEYKFIVNGVWIHNPDAPENVPNVHGSLNSVMEVHQ
jgi:1,4-alpha-glucan branching enzyme